MIAEENFKIVVAEKEHKKCMDEAFQLYESLCQSKAVLYRTAFLSCG